MKLIFSKEDNEIIAKIEVNGDIKDFNYIELIKYLHKNNLIEEILFHEGILNAEKEKINEMITNINDAVIKESIEV